MEWKQQFLASLDGVMGFEKDAFIHAHQTAAPVSIRLNPSKAFDPKDVFAAAGIMGEVPWCPDGYYLHNRPVFTLEPLLHAGAFYVQEASSMFIRHVLDSVFQQDKNLKALDLCAAPGGKTTLIASLPYFGTVLANEIIQSRVGVLAENMVKWGSSHVLISNNDPEEVALLGEQFDLVLTDAPCSGSGLFRKDEAAMDEWSPAAVELCAARQKRILQHAMSLVKDGGYLLYSTCSYSLLENEVNADFIMASGLFESVAIEVKDEWGIVKTESAKHHASCFRFYPNRLSGEGFFCAMFRKTGGSSSAEDIQQSKPFPAARIVQQWLQHPIPDMAFHMKDNTVFMLEAASFSAYQEWSGFLKIRKSGLKMGDLIREELVPDHELAMSPYLSSETPVIELDKERAIRYLRKDDVTVDRAALGWHIVKYSNQAIGWAKMVNGRLKNHYPLNWRILMQAR